MSKAPKLRVVDDTPATPETQWLALSREIAAIEARARRLRAIRQALKPGIMSKLGAWGMADDQVTAALEVGRG